MWCKIKSGQINHGKSNRGKSSITVLSLGIQLYNSRLFTGKLTVKTLFWLWNMFIFCGSLIKEVLVNRHSQAFYNVALIKIFVWCKQNDPIATPFGIVYLFNSKMWNMVETFARSPSTEFCKKKKKDAHCLKMTRIDEFLHG
jgi:hypothetical protein